MIRGIWAPSDLISTDKDPTVSKEDKLKIIKASPVTLVPHVWGTKVMPSEFSVTLPFVSGGSFSSGLGEFGSIVFSDYVSVGDENLYGQGIGTRLLKAAFRYAVEQEPRTNTFQTGWVRLGLINTIVKVLGEENVAVNHGSNYRYGWQSDRPIEAMFDDFPNAPEQPYLKAGVEAFIDKDLALRWDMPVIETPVS